MKWDILEGMQLIQTWTFLQGGLEQKAMLLPLQQQEYGMQNQVAQISIAGLVGTRWCNLPKQLRHHNGLEMSPLLEEFDYMPAQMPFHYVNKHLHLERRQ